MTIRRDTGSPRGWKGYTAPSCRRWSGIEILTWLDEIIRIRVLQNFAPSQALAFIFLLKNVIRHELAEEIRKENLAAELLDLESRIDGLALLGFDVYTKRREKLYEIKADEVKRQDQRVYAQIRPDDDSL